MANWKKFQKFLCVFFCVLFCFVWIFQPMEAHAVATEVALTWLIYGLFTAAGLSTSSLIAVEHQNPLTDLRAGGEAGRLIDRTQNFYNGSPLEVKNALLRLAGQLALAEGERIIKNTFQNREDLDTVLPAVEDYLENEFEIYDLQTDWASASPKSYSIDRPFFDGSSVGLGEVTVTQNHVNGVYVPTVVHSGSVSYLPGSSGVFPADVVAIMGPSGTNFGYYVYDILKVKGYSHCYITLFDGLAPLTLDFYKRHAGSGSGYDYLCVELRDGYSDGASLGYQNSYSWNVSSPWDMNFVFYIVNVSGGNVSDVYVEVRAKNIAYGDALVNLKNHISTSNFGRFVNWAYKTYQANNPTYTVYGTGALELVEPELYTKLIEFPTPPGDPEDPDDDNKDIPLIFIPSFPTRPAEDPDEAPEPVTDPQDFVFNDFTIFNQQQMTEGYPDQIGDPDPGPDDPGGGDINIPQNPPVNIPISPPTSLGLSGIWHYVVETYEYADDFWDFLQLIYQALPQPIMFLGWASIVLLITIGFFRRMVGG